MNKRSIVISTVITFMVFGSLVQAAGPDKLKRKRMLRKGRFVTVAKLDAESGKIMIREQVLRKKFADGGKIERFEVKEFIDGYNLLRMGTDKDGKGHVEAFPLKMKAGELVLGKLKWFVTCDITAANCVNRAFCLPNYEKTACQCPDGPDCTFGRGSSIEIDYVLVQNPEYPDRW